MNKKRVKPPALPHSLLLRFLRDELAEEVEGDLEEKFYNELKHASAFKAKLNYWYQVIHYLRPFAIRKNKFTAIYYDMYQNYFRVSWRGLLRQKMYSAIKIGGLAIGVAACFLISLYVKDEMSYDKNFVRGNGPYRLVVQAQIDENKTERTVDFPAPAAAALRADFPEVEKAGRYLSSPLFGAHENEIRRSDRNENQHEGGFVYFDQELLELLEVPVIAGNLKYALTDPNSIV
ncbi:MAG TPA: permease prefix domain 2-containing transporter, partial [Cyclobacteriaceae bacterium]|nr:permease prefix domain 2-containing transporter [Cyclobacteriaceae bacterium]